MDLNEFNFDPDNPPAGIRVNGDELAVDHRVHGGNITASHAYPYGHRVTLTINGVPLEFHRDFNPDFAGWFAENNLPMDWVRRYGLDPDVGTGELITLRERWEAMQDG